MPRTSLEILITNDDCHGLPYLKDYRVAQVTTHGHDRPIPALLPTWKEFAGTMHRDNVSIPVWDAGQHAPGWRQAHAPQPVPLPPRRNPVQAIHPYHRPPGEFDEVAANFSSVAYWYQQR